MDPIWVNLRAKGAVFSLGGWGRVVRAKIEGKNPEGEIEGKILFPLPSDLFPYPLVSWNHDWQITRCNI